MNAPFTTGQPIDTRDLVTIHTFFRREFRLAGGVVRSVPGSAGARARVVADHLDFVARSLHHHHTAEEELAWPILLERLPEELAPIVHLMQSQHARVDGLLREMAEILPRWSRTALEADRERLAEVCDTLYAHLAEHLDAEEQRLLPIAARALTLHEWQAIASQAWRRTRCSELLLTFGMLLHEGDPEVLARMISTSPAPVRWLLPRLARRAFRRTAILVHGTATP